MTRNVVHASSEDKVDFVDCLVIEHFPISGGRRKARRVARLIDQRRGIVTAPHRAPRRARTSPRPRSARVRREARSSSAAEANSDGPPGPKPPSAPHKPEESRGLDLPRGPRNDPRAEVLRLRVEEWTPDGRDRPVRFVAIRLWFRAQDGTYRPTQKGTTLRTGELLDVIEWLTGAARELGIEVQS